MIKTFLFLAIVPSSFCAARSNVVISGTTSSPTQVNEVKLALAECPLTHPFTIGGGTKCCGSSHKPNNVALHADCDGGPITGHDSELCCDEGDRVRCPTENAICKDHPDAAVDGGWSAWGPWTVEVSRDYESVVHPDLDAMPKGTCLMVTNPPSGITIEYCHLERITYTTGGVDTDVGLFPGHWDDRSESVDAFSKVKQNS